MYPEAWASSSLSKIMLRFFSTVLMEMCSFSEIAALVCPCASVSRTLRSRGVSRASGSLCVVRITSCRTTSGSMAAPPASIRSSASRNSSTWATRSFSR
ncbi:hypothetical protein SVIOM342S_10055 [Streptomyces violaceorubidus]